MSIALDKLKQLRKGKIKLSVSDANKWFKQVIRDSGKKDKIGGKTNIIISGTMVTYLYDPKGKDTLPYYDMHPLGLIVDVNSTGWTMINLHYLPVEYRLILLENLMKKTIGKGKRERVKISYDMMKGAAKFKYFVPCYKKYLSTHIKSKMILIPEEDWIYAAMMSTQKFKKASRQEVYKDSLRIARS